MTATVPPVSDLRDCHLYRFWVRHPLTGRRVLGYVGETVRAPFERLMEHVCAQPWADTILAWEVDDVTYAGKAEVLEAESVAIRAERPLYNVRENERNPLRIPPPIAIRQRRARDAERNRPRWVHPDDRADARSVPASAIRRTPSPRRWSPRQQKAGLWSLAWAMTTVVTSGLLARLGVFATWPANTLCGSLGSLLLLVWSLAGAPVTRRQWRRLRRRLTPRWMR